MRILGVDPGSNATGYGFIDYQKRKTVILEAGTIKPKSKDPLHLRIHKIYTNLSELVDQYHPDVLVLEKIYAHHTFKTTAGILGHVRGVICLLCAQKEIELIEYSVKRVRKAVTGNGNSTKVQTRSMVSHILNIDEKCLTLDASDAIALALGYTHMDGRGL